MNSLTSVSNKKQLREQIKKHTEAFLKSGGKIKRIPFGVQTDERFKGFS